MEKQKRQPSELVSDFLAPYPIEKCRLRLEARAGDYFSRGIEVEVYPLASTGEYDFKVRLTRGANREQYLPECRGVLSPQDETSTVVKVYHAVSGQNVQLIILTVVLLLGGAAMACGRADCGWFVGAIGLIVVCWYLEGQAQMRQDELLDMVYASLGYTPDRARQG